MMLMCKKDHQRTTDGKKYQFKSGNFYYVKDNNIKHPKHKHYFYGSSLFIKTRFVDLAEWRDIQINSILED